jgi:hypothetical protein
MIPILSGIIVGHGHAISKGRALALSLLYVLGMAVTYAAAGVAAGLSGTLLAAALQNPWVLGGFALVFVVLAFSMFGFYELQLPTALQSKLSDSANHRQGGSPGGVVAMGALSALIVGPCVAAAGRRAALHRQERRRGAGRRGLFTMALGHGRAADRGRRAGPQRAAQARPVDGGRAARLRGDAAGRGGVAGLAGAAEHRADAGLGRAADLLGDLPPRPRPAAPHAAAGSVSGRAWACWR